MSALNARIERLLSTLKAEGRSSPDGIHWQQFFEFLKGKKQAVSKENPPVPLILAASGESNASKHRRLASQLAWAMENDCLEEAIHYLQNIPTSCWNSGPVNQWEQDSYWRP